MGLIGFEIIGFSFPLRVLQYIEYTNLSKATDQHFSLR
jgi:hypothetical protein